MGTISEKLTYLEETKELIKQAIVDKGVEVNDTDTFRSYADKISEIEGGGGAVVLPSCISFQDAKDSDLSFFINANTDTSKLTTMKYMFKNCENLTNIDVSNFDTSNVTDMSEMFFGCSLLTNLDVSRWDTSNCTNFQEVFYSSGIKFLNISNWDLSKSSESSYSTGSAQLFRGMNGIQTIECQNTKVPEKVYYLGYMFQGCTSLRTFGYFDKFNPAYVRDLSEAFSGCSQLKSIDWSEKMFDTSQSYINCGNTFKSCGALKSVKLNTTNKFKCGGMFYGSGLEEVDFEGVNFETGGTVYGGMFENCNYLRKAENVDFEEYSYTNNLYQCFRNCGLLEKIVMNWKGVYADSYFLSGFYNQINSTATLRYIHLKNIGTQKNNTDYKFNTPVYCNFYNWGVEDVTNYPYSEGARQSLVDTIVNDSCDRVAAGYSTCTIHLHPEVIARLTEDEIAQATAKGYTLSNG